MCPFTKVPFWVPIFNPQPDLGWFGFCQDLIQLLVEDFDADLDGPLSRAGAKQEVPIWSGTHVWVLPETLFSGKTEHRT